MISISGEPTSLLCWFLKAMKTDYLSIFLNFWFISSVLCSFHYIDPMYILLNLDKPFILFLREYKHLKIFHFPILMLICSNIINIYIFTLHPETCIYIYIYIHTHMYILLVLGLLFLFMLFKILPVYLHRLLRHMEIRKDVSFFRFI